MYALGQRLVGCYLSPLDKLIGFIGDAGAGKSSLIRGMFPGLELTNDDEGVNIRPLPILRVGEKGFFCSHTYHVDIRFEMAFTQVHELAEAILRALDLDKRVIVEHFDLIFPYLGRNGDVLVGVGGEIILSRPTVFGPVPKEIGDIVTRTLRYRKMAHTAEDLTSWVLLDLYKVKAAGHRDVNHGYVLEFEEKPEVELERVSTEVKKLIDEDIPVCHVDECHIRIGERSWICTGPRTHVQSTGDIENFHVMPELKYDPQSKTYLLIGLVGSKNDDLDGLAALIEAAK